MSNIIQFPVTEAMKDRKTAAAVAAFLAKHLAGAPKPASSSTLAAKRVSRDRRHFDLAKAALGIVLVESFARGHWFWALPGEEHLVPDPYPQRRRSAY